VTLRAEVLWCAWLCACASNEPDMAEPKIDVDASAGGDVLIMGDGFVRAGGERIPFEAFVLRERQRLRALPREERAKSWVRIQLDARAGEAAIPYRNRLLDELRLMGMGTVLFR
jgi:hypothetical protein